MIYPRIQTPPWNRNVGVIPFSGHTWILQDKKKFRKTPRVRQDFHNLETEVLNSLLRLGNLRKMGLKDPRTPLWEPMELPTQRRADPGVKCRAKPS